MKHKAYYITVSIVLLALIQITPSSAARQGKAELILQQISPGDLVSAGDTLTVALWIDARNEPITGVAIYLTIDETYLALIPHQTHPQIPPPRGLRPFRQGLWLKGNVFSNETLGDVLDNSMANNLPGFQLHYFEDIPTNFSGTRETAAGKGILTEVRLRLLQNHPNPLQTIRVDHISPTGSESGYFHINHPGVVYSLSVIYDENRSGDFNGDRKRDFHDFLLFVNHYGQPSTASHFSALYDLDGNSEIDFADFILFSQSFGK